MNELYTELVIFLEKFMEILLFMVFLPSPHFRYLVCIFLICGGVRLSFLFFRFLTVTEKSLKMLFELKKEKKRKKVFNSKCEHTEISS